MIDRLSGGRASGGIAAAIRYDRDDEFALRRLRGGAFAAGECAACRHGGKEGALTCAGE